MNVQALLSNFALILFVLMVVTGVIWFFDRFYLAKQRRAAADRRCCSCGRGGICGLGL